MTTEKLYEKIKTWRDVVQLEGMTATAYEMNCVLESLENDMRLAEAKKSGNVNIVKAANRIIKSAQSDLHENLKGMFTNVDKYGDTKYCVCDGYRAVRFNDKMALPEIDEKYHGQEFDLNRICIKADGAKEIELPDIADVKVWTKTQTYVENKQKKVKPYLLNEEIGLYVNPKYLINMMECLPDAKVYATTAISAIYFEAEDGDGILLPVRNKG